MVGVKQSSGDQEYASQHGQGEIASHMRSVECGAKDKVSQEQECCSASIEVIKDAMIQLKHSIQAIQIPFILSLTHSVMNASGQIYVISVR